MSDITKHKWSSENIEKAEFNSDSKTVLLWMECQCGAVGINKDDAIATARHFYDQMTAFDQVNFKSIRPDFITTETLRHGEVVKETVSKTGSLFFGKNQNRDIFCPCFSPCLRVSVVNHLVRPAGCRPAVVGFRFIVSSAV